MLFVYYLGIRIYYLAICIASAFNGKARQWLSGRKGLFQLVKQRMTPHEKILWFHVASLGEFEQGRPVIEAIRKKHTEYKILITFFSPSGYEIRKNYAGADYVFYLPLDTLRNARKFVELLQPEKVFFVKYEFWFNFLRVLHQKKIPVYLISGIFRKNHLFFRWYGKGYGNILGFFTHFYVQNRESYQLLTERGFNNVTLSGDTRFDRVTQIASDARETGIAERFVKGSPVVICGSTWDRDEELLMQYINDCDEQVKFIIAPHEIHESHILNIVAGLKITPVRYSQADSQPLEGRRVLIIDNIGLLSTLYKYGDIAYIGGGFGAGIHNILEAAAFGLPIVFGPNYRKFTEAYDLIGMKGAFSISTFPELRKILDLLLKSRQEKEKAGRTAQKYVAEHQGATSKILRDLFNAT